MTRRHTTRSARYGQACLTCAKAKCRCIARPDGDGCERCHRLRKECQAPEPVSRRRHADSNPEPHGRIAELEGRLQGVMALLQARNLVGSESLESLEDDRVDQSRHRSTMSTSPPLTLDTTLSEDADTDADIDIDVDLDSNDDHRDTTPIPAPFARVSDQLDQLSARCLDTFRSCMLPYFPFFLLAPSLTVEQLRRERPLLLQAITCVTWPIPQEKRARAAELKRALCEAAYLKRQEDDQSSGTDNVLDLLLGLMTYIAWGWDYVYNRGSLSRLMMLCVSMVGEMHLDRCAPKEPHTGNLLPPTTRRRIHEHEARLSAERQRAVLGCFVLSSIVSEYFADMDAMKWTLQLEDTLFTISETKASPTDTDLVLQVRLQLLSTKAIRLRDSLQQHPNQVEPSIPAAQIVSDAENLLAQLQELRRTSSSSYQPQQQTQLAHTYYVELIILETIRVSSAEVSRLSAPIIPVSTPSNASNCGTEDHPSPIGYSDLSYMWQSVLAISACTSGLLSLSSDFHGISFLQWEQLAGCVVVLSHLEGLEEERINRAHARGVVDLPVLLDRIADKLTLTATDAGEHEPSGVFLQLAAGIRAFRSSIQPSLVESGQSGPGAGSGCAGSNAQTYQHGYFMNNKFWMDQLFIGGSL